MVVELSKRITKTAATMAGRSQEMNLAANKIKTAVEAEAGKHYKHGAFSGGIRIIRRKMDRYIVSDDPLAWHKEFGHLTRSGKGGKPKWVKGIFVFTNTARRLAK